MVDVTRDMLHEAIAIYLKCAYPTGEIPAVVHERIALDSNRSVSEVLESPPFEHYVANAPFHCTVYALRLGSADYPHLKLEIRPFTNRIGYVFWVNTHDQFLSPNDRFADADRWRQLVKRNCDLKQAVERAWAEARLPTFTTAMQEGLVDTAQP